MNDIGMTVSGTASGPTPSARVAFRRIDRQNHADDRKNVRPAPAPWPPSRLSRPMSLLAYLLAPFAWRHYEHQTGLADLGARTFTAQGIPGDVVNVGLEGTEADVVCAMTAAGWSPSDPVTLSSSLRIVGSVAFRRPYHRAPVSPLFFDGRRQDLAFEKPSGRSASTRHHVRFWKALDSGDDGRPVWLGAATFDDGARGQPLHRADHPSRGAGHRRRARFPAGRSRPRRRGSRRPIR